MKKYIDPTVKVVEIDYEELISSSPSLPNDKWYVEDGHVYNPGGKDKCGTVDGFPAHNAKASIFDQEW